MDETKITAKITAQDILTAISEVEKRVITLGQRTTEIAGAAQEGRDRLINVAQEIADLRANGINATAESPFVWWRKFRSADGTEECYTVRASTIGELARLIEAAKGIMPEPLPPLPGDEQPQRRPEHGPEWCPIHQVEMKLRSSDNGDEWFSHRTADGEWCRGKEAKQRKKR